MRGDLLAFDRQAACRVRPKSSLTLKLHLLIAGSWIIPLVAPASRSGARPNFRTGLNWCLGAPGNIVASSGPRVDGWGSHSESNAPRTLLLHNGYAPGCDRSGRDDVDIEWNTPPFGQPHLGRFVGDVGAVNDKTFEAVTHDFVALLHIDRKAADIGHEHARAAGNV